MPGIIWPVILKQKDKAPRHLAAVTWHHDHHDSPQKKPRLDQYFLCTDLSLAAQEALRLYQRRWPVEA